eukprot:TRINITY_DN845_c0_g4_i1.p1 TRINITY_DN845_c0_g4~~TRINITY_DN845_c0_g4_i1.p1  ORF type:complete len:408 (-),score=127.75 TRINITY_DN845_c0_g4_i1:249-1472(-)
MDDKEKNNNNKNNNNDNNNKSYKKKSVCRYFLENRCTKGDKCTYSHVQSKKNYGGKNRNRNRNRNKSNNNKKKRLCSFFLKDTCDRGDKCGFSHDMEKKKKFLLKKRKQGYFYCFRIVVPDVNDSPFSRFIEEAKDLEPNLNEKVLEPLEKTHITCGVFFSNEMDHIEIAKQILDESKEEILNILNNEPLTLNLKSVDFFSLNANDDMKQAIYLFALVDNQQAMKDIKILLENKLIDKGITIPEKQYEYRPHLTLMKKSSTLPTFDITNILTGDNNIKDFDFGQTTVPCISLCKMSSTDDQTGFYESIHSIDLLSENGNENENDNKDDIENENENENENDNENDNDNKDDIKNENKNENDNKDDIENENENENDNKDDIENENKEDTENIKENESDNKDDNYDGNKD